MQIKWIFENQIVCWVTETQSRFAGLLYYFAIFEISNSPSNTPINKVHKYNTRLSSKMSYSLPKARTNYGIFNIRFQGVKVWNSLDESTKLLSPPQFKKKLKLDFIDNY